MEKRNRMPRLVAALVCCSLAAAAVLGAAALFTDINAAPRCICPMVYAPVKCSNGKTYSNLCFANCAHATNCIPVIIIPPPV